MDGVVGGGVGMAVVVWSLGMVGRHVGASKDPLVGEGNHLWSLAAMSNPRVRWQPSC